MVENQGELEVKLTQCCKSKQEARGLLEKVFGSSKYIKETEAGLEVGGLLLYQTITGKRILELVKRYSYPDIRQNLVRIYNLLDQYGYAKALGKIDVSCLRNAIYYDNLAANVTLCYQFGVKAKDLKAAWFRSDESPKRLLRTLKKQYRKRPHHF